MVGTSDVSAVHRSYSSYFFSFFFLGVHGYYLDFIYRHLVEMLDVPLAFSYIQPHVDGPSASRAVLHRWIGAVKYFANGVSGTGISLPITARGQLSDVYKGTSSGP